MIAYLDASALVPVMKEEKTSGAVRAFLDQLDADLHLLVSGWLLDTEVRRTALRQGLTNEVASAALRPINLIQHERQDYRMAGRLTTRSLGSLDAMHLATALRVGADVMLTQDASLVDACDEHGLPVLALPSS
jgi:uncharacterized protein